MAAMPGEPVFVLTVLVVENLDDTAQSTAELLTLRGHAVRVAGCGADTLATVAADTPVDPVALAGLLVQVRDSLYAPAGAAAEGCG